MLASTAPVAGVARPSPSPGPRCTSADPACWPSSTTLRALGAALEGDVVLPGDLSWGTVTALKNKRLSGTIEPGVVVMAESADDVIAAVTFAASRNRTLAASVKSSGHCYSGNCMESGSLHLDLTRMRDLALDTDDMVMHVQPGTNFAAMYALADASGVHVVGGMCPTVGPVGYSLGGGHGPLIRSYGLGADNIVSAQMVTTGGALVNASATENPQLFWALRGGGGGAFGVVVSLALRIHRAPPQMVGLSCAWPLTVDGNRVGEPVLSKWFSEVMPALPDEWHFFTIAMKQPLAPGTIPGWNRNRTTMDGVVDIEGLYNGPFSPAVVSSAADVVQLGVAGGIQLKCGFRNYTSFKAWHDAAWWGSEGPIPFREYMASSFVQPDFDKAGHAKLVTDQLLALPAGAINIAVGVQLGGKVSRPDTVWQGNTGGAAAAATNASAVSAAFRNAVALQENDSDWLFEWSDNKQIAWAHGVGDAFAALSGLSGAYVNEADPALGRDTYPDRFWGDATFAQLQAVKRAWDAESMLDCNQCVFA